MLNKIFNNKLYLDKSNKFEFQTVKFRRLKTTFDPWPMTKWNPYET